MGDKKVSVKREPNKTERLMEKYGALVAIALLLLLYFMPLPNGMSLEGQRSLAIFVFALIMWVAKPIPIYLTSLIAILMLPLSGAVESQKVVFGTLGFDVIWLMVAAFVLTSAMNETNLGKRFALIMVTRFGKTPKRLLGVLVVVNFVLAFFVPSTTARASLLVPIVLILLEIYQALPGESRFGKLLMLQGIQNNHFATSMIMTATSGQVIAIGFINEMTGANIGYMDWLLGSMPQAIISAIILFFIGLKIYKPEDIEGDIKAVNQRLKQQLHDLGKISEKEKKAAIYFGLTLFLWATGDIQEAVIGFSLSTVQTAVLSMILMLMPKIGVIEWKQANIKWDLMLFSAGAYAAGNALNDSGGATWLIDRLINAIGIDKLPIPTVAVILIFISVFSHIIFTSKTVRVTIVIPAVVTLATSLGMDPIPIAMACSFGIAYTFTLPPHSKVNTLYFSTGYFSVLDELKFGLIASFVGSSVISILYFTWLQVIF